MWPQLTIFSTVIFIPLEVLGAGIILFIMLIWCCDLCLAIQMRLSPVLERRRMERARQPGDVTTELATAPGETSSDP